MPFYVELPAAVVGPHDRSLNKAAEAALSWGFGVRIRLTPLQLGADVGLWRVSVETAAVRHSIPTTVYIFPVHPVGDRQYGVAFGERPFALLTSTREELVCVRAAAREAHIPFHPTGEREELIVQLAATWQLNEPLSTPVRNLATKYLGRLGANVPNYWYMRSPTSLADALLLFGSGPPVTTAAQGMDLPGPELAWCQYVIDRHASPAWYREAVAAYDRAVADDPFAEATAAFIYRQDRVASRAADLRTAVRGMFPEPPSRRREAPTAPRLFEHRDFVAAAKALAVEAKGEGVARALHLLSHWVVALTSGLDGVAATVESEDRGRALVVTLREGDGPPATVRFELDPTLVRAVAPLFAAYPAARAVPTAADPRPGFSFD